MEVIKIPANSPTAFVELTFDLEDSNGDAISQYVGPNNNQLNPAVRLEISSDNPDVVNNVAVADEPDSKFNLQFGTDPGTANLTFSVIRIADGEKIGDDVQEFELTEDVPDEPVVAKNFALNFLEQQPA